LSVNFYIFDFFSRIAGPILTRLDTNHAKKKRGRRGDNEGLHPCSAAKIAKE
jgi:hypothetical protein